MTRYWFAPCRGACISCYLTRNEPKKQTGGGAEGFTGSLPRWCRVLFSPDEKPPSPGPLPAVRPTIVSLFQIVLFASLCHKLKFQTER